MPNDREPATVPAEDNFGQILSLLAKQKQLSPPLFLAALSLTNLLGIVNYLNSIEGLPLSGTASRSGPEKQALTNTLLSLLASEGSGDKKEALLTGLMGALGGSGSGKKLDPAALLSLAGSLAGQMEKSPAAPAQYATDQASSSKGPQGEVRELNARRG